MSLKGVFKTLFNAGAKTLVAALSIGGGEIGGLAANVITTILGIDKNDPDFQKKIDSLSKTQEGRLKILEAENYFRLESKKLLSNLEHAKINAQLSMFEQSQESYRAELIYAEKTGDWTVAQYRPKIVRSLFHVARAMVVSLMFAFLADLVTETLLLKRCTDLEQVGEEVAFIEIQTQAKNCFDFLNTRIKYSTTISKMYADNWVWLSPLYGIFITWFGGRSWEKNRGTENNKTSDEV